MCANNAGNIERKVMLSTSRMIGWRLLALLALGGCGNELGNISSTSTGDTSRPTERKSPVDDLRTACGIGQPTAYGESLIQRHPYLQQVTSSSAMLGWVTTQPVGTRVVLKKADGTEMPAANAAQEDVALRDERENQMWAEMQGLEPSTVYCYSLADETGALTEPTGFRTAPAPDDNAPVRFLAFGDSGGGGADQYALMEQMFTVPYDLMLHTGDIAYSDGTIGQYEDNVFGVYQGLFRSIPFFPASGNHDYRTLSGAPFRDVFNLPGDNGEKWYSFDWGRVHFASLDTEADYAKQAAWLDKDLEGSKAPWKIVYMHRPPYSSGKHGSDTKLQKLLSPILVKHGVQLVLAGHDHNYERIKPQEGVHYIVTGGGGVGTRSVGSSPFTELSEDVIHFVQGEVFEDRMVLHAIDATGREFDSVEIRRD